MSVNFSTITPMNPSTISRKPAYTTTQQPAASSPMDTAYYQPKKKSRWFLKTLIAAAVVLGGAAALRGKVDMFKNFDVASKLPSEAKFGDKAAFYGKKAVATVGDFATKYWNKAAVWVQNLFSKKPAA